MRLRHSVEAGKTFGLHKHELTYNKIEQFSFQKAISILSLLSMHRFSVKIINIPVKYWAFSNLWIICYSSPVFLFIITSLYVYKLRLRPQYILFILTQYSREDQHFIFYTYILYFPHSLTFKRKNDSLALSKKMIRFNSRW